MSDSNSKANGGKARGDRGPLTKARLGISPGLPLQVSEGGIDELRRDIQRLMDIEAIKQVKHAYFRCIDTANHEELATLFHDDVLVHFVGGTYEWTLSGKKEYVESVAKSFHKQSIGHHNGHHPEILIHSESEATGIWYLADHMWILNHDFLTTGTAVYWDRYVKEGGRWLIRETRYERVYEINQALKEKPQLSTHYLANYGSDPE